jgi:hypothetical protein
MPLLSKDAFAIDLAQKYWDVANAIVAFSVLQMLAFLYALGNHEFRGQVAKAYGFVISATAISSVLYVVGVVGCYFAERKLCCGEIGPDARKLLRNTLFVRIAVI